MPTDHVELILKQWQQVRPDADSSPMAIVGRVYRLNKHWGPELDKVFKAFELSSIQFDVLASLRRNDRPLSPTELYKSTMLSSGAMTTNLDKLEQRGLLVRIRNDEDRRGCMIEITAAGRTLIDEAVDQHLANEQNLLSPLSPEERALMASLLKKCLLPWEG